MITSLGAIFLIIALVLFAIAAFFHWFRPTENRVNLVAAGLFFYALRELVA